LSIQSRSIEQCESPDSEIGEFADAERFNGNIIRHSQYARGQENIVEETNKYDIPEITPLNSK